MMRFAMLYVLAVTAVADLASAQSTASGPSYQRRRGEQREYAPSHGYYRPRRGSFVSSGTFQRPYPYHLDYYKKQYGGTYEPYFGNLYGPPNVVLGAPYGPYGYPFPYGYGFQPQHAPPVGAQYAPPVGAPAQPPVAVCPHCHQPLEYAAPVATGEAKP